MEGWSEEGIDGYVGFRELLIVMHPETVDNLALKGSLAPGLDEGWKLQESGELDDAARAFESVLSGRHESRQKLIAASLLARMGRTLEDADQPLGIVVEVEPQGEEDHILLGAYEDGSFSVYLFSDVGEISGGALWASNVLSRWLRIPARVVRAGQQIESRFDIVERLDDVPLGALARVTLLSCSGMRSALVVSREEAEPLWRAIRRLFGFLRWFDLPTRGTITAVGTG